MCSRAREDEALALLGSTAQSDANDSHQRQIDRQKLAEQVFRQFFGEHNVCVLFPFRIMFHTHQRWFVLALLGSTTQSDANDSHQRQIYRQKLSEQAFLLIFSTSVTLIFKSAFHTLTHLNMMPTI